jgi:hypothetical protein
MGAYERRRKLHHRRGMPQRLQGTCILQSAARLYNLLPPGSIKVMPMPSPHSLVLHMPRERIRESFYCRVLHWLVALSMACVLMMGCGNNEDFATEVAPESPPQLILTSENHPGWGLSNCLLCHQVFQIHLSTTNPEIDLEEIRRVVDQSGPDSCMFCHGANGT